MDETKGVLRGNLPADVTEFNNIFSGLTEMPLPCEALDLNDDGIVDDLDLISE